MRMFEKVRVRQNDQSDHKKMFTLAYGKYQSVL